MVSCGVQRSDPLDSKLVNLEAGIGGKLLWLMVEDFNEFSAIVTNPVERLHLKQFVKTHGTSIDTSIERVTPVPHIIVSGSYSYIYILSALIHRIQRAISIVWMMT